MPHEDVSILVLDLMTENHPLWVWMQRFAQPGAEGIKEEEEKA